MPIRMIRVFGFGSNMQAVKPYSAGYYVHNTFKRISEYCQRAGNKPCSNFYTE